MRNREIRDMKAALLAVLAGIDPTTNPHLRDELSVARGIVKVEDLEYKLRDSKRKLAEMMRVFSVNNVVRRSIVVDPSES